MSPEIPAPQELDLTLSLQPNGHYVSAAASTFYYQTATTARATL